MTWSLHAFTTPLKFPPGTGWVYGTSLDWAGHLIWVIACQNLSSFMQENIFDPLGMTSTRFDPSSITDYASRKVDWAVGSDTNVNHLKLGTTIVPDSHEMDSGGAGLFSTTSDYAKFLAALLRGEILQPSSYELMFSPQLTPTEKEAYKQALAGDMWDYFVPELYPPGAPLDHGLSGVLNLEDSPDRRKKGSLMWSGASNGRWWIDRESGIAAVMTTQVQPFNHPLAVKLFRDLELAVYRELV
jgi:CubicO group peptidase (beta-lactamase class C family)